jgi:predicted nuclease of restriction endonuclease-like (RecB) superfamily
MNYSPIALPADYAQWLASLKQRIQSARQQALLAANSEQIRLYHDIGREILERQSRQGWGAKVVDRLSSDLRAAFPDMKGLSASNLKYMRFFALECPDRLIGQQSADQLPWFHIVTLITKLQDQGLREWYAPSWHVILRTR